MTRRNPWDEDTRPNVRARPDLLRPSFQQRVAEQPAPDDDELADLGKMMRQTADNTTAVQALRVDFDVLAREVRQSARAAPDTIHSTAKQASNRIAILMGSLFTVYEVTAPWVREFVRQVLHR